MGGQDPPANEPNTLASVLYANREKARVPETYWVALVSSVAGGDQAALHALYAQTHRMVFTLVVRIIGNRETAEEVTLDVFHDVWRKSPSYDPAGGSVVGWIMNQARSRAIDRLRFEHRKKRIPCPADGPMEPVAATGPQEALEAGEQGFLLRQALLALTRDERQAIEAAFFGELTYAEVAENLDQPLGTIKTRIRSGLGKLRQALSARDRP